MPSPASVSINPNAGTATAHPLMLMALGPNLGGAAGRSDGTNGLASSDDFASLLQTALEAESELTGLGTDSIQTAGLIPDALQTTDLETTLPGDASPSDAALQLIVQAESAAPPFTPNATALLVSAVAQDLARPLPPGIQQALPGLALQTRGASPNSQSGLIASAKGASTLESDTADSATDRASFPDLQSAFVQKKIATTAEAGKPGELKPEAGGLLGLSSHQPLSQQAAPATTAPPHSAHLPQAALNAAASLPLPVHAPVHTPQWGQEIGQRMLWMAKNDLQSAQLTLNPAHLGPIEVTLTMDRDVVSAHFVSPHAEIRDLLEQSLPKLKEIFAAGGVDLTQTNVGGQSRQQHFAEFFGAKPGDRHSFSEPSADNEPMTAPAPALSRMGNGLIDTFA